MISNRDLASISLEDLVNRIDIHHQEMDVLYQTLAIKMSKQTNSTTFLSDKNVRSYDSLKAIRSSIDPIVCL